MTFQPGFSPSLSLSPSLSVTYIMRGLYVSHNWSHMSVFSLQQEAQNGAQACHRPTRPPTASHTAPEVHRLCWQGDLTPARHTKNHLTKLSVCSAQVDRLEQNPLTSEFIAVNCQVSSAVFALLHPFLVTSHRRYVTFLNETNLSSIQVWHCADLCATVLSFNKCLSFILFNISCILVTVLPVYCSSL